MRTLFCVLFVLLAVQAVVAQAVQLQSFVLPEVKFADLVTLDHTALQSNIDRLMEEGAVQITGIPRFGMVRKRALEDLAECFVEEQTAANVELPDGSRRVTSAAKSRRGLAGEMSHVCGEAAGKLRSAVDAAMSQLFLALDVEAAVQSRGNKQKQLLMEPHYDSFRELMGKGEHLEHLHSYFAPKAGASSALANSGSPATLDYHVDGGFVIAMTTGLYSHEAASENSGLYMELRNGQRVKVEAADDSLIVLMGDGAARWLRPVLGRAFPAAKHALIADLAAGSQAARSWYGKMYLPPADAIIPQEGVSYDQYRAVQNQHLPQLKDMSDLSADKALRALLPSACGGEGNHYMTLSAGDCAANEMYCWATCMALPPGCSLSDAMCINTRTGEVSPGENHCMDNGDTFCEPICFYTPNNSTDSYCSGVGTSMYMSGFQSIAEKGEGEVQCVNLFFEQWTLDSRVKYAFACLGIFAMGIFIQYLSKLRVMVSKLPDSWVRKLSIVSIYCLHVTLGYFAMLAAMTYSVELFCMVCSGLTVGFAIFHLDHPHNAKSTDPCCPDVDDEAVYSEKEDMLRNEQLSTAKIISP